MFCDYVVTVDTQYSGHFEADFNKEALKLFNPVDWDDAENVDEITVKSIDDIEKREDEE